MKFFKAVTLGGPLGLAHALREAWVARRIRHIAWCIDQERSLHRAHMAQLRREQLALELRQAAITQRASAFWRSLS